MKLCLLVIPILWLAASASAQLGLPDHVYELKEWRQASAVAIKNKQPMAFIVGKPFPKIPASTEAMHFAFRALKRSYQVVMVDSQIEDRFQKMPKGAVDLRPPGKVSVPWVVFASPDGSKGIHYVPTRDFRDGLRAAMREVDKKIEKDPGLLEAKKTDDDDAEKTKAEHLAPMQDWFNAKGVKISAAVEKIEAGSVVFILPDGRRVPYPLEKLAAGSQTKLMELESN